MPDSAIRIKNISKYFSLDKPQNESFTEGLVNLGMSILKISGNVSKKNGFWALKDISLNIKKGETLGIFGGNGAGKTTLLKILSEVTQPTQGEVEIEGKIASVLEVGMGFHPDLTGKENIFLSASILGMGRNEVKTKISEIIKFSGIGQFIDLPIKHYSSGMYVRLAFSLAAHISADILIFDEVLSVGDAEFKLKTLKKISELRNEGITIILVTHNLSEILNLCNRAIIMENGQIKALGRPSELISDYVEDAHNLAMNDAKDTANDESFEKEISINNSREWKDIKTAPGNKTARIKKIIVKRREGELTDEIYTKNDIEVEISFQKLLEQNTIDVLAFLSKQNALTFVAIIPLTIYFFSDTPKGFAKEAVKYLYDKISAYSGFIASVLKAYFGFLVRLLITNMFFVIAVVCYLIAIAKGGSGFYEWTAFFMVVHFNTNTKNKVSQLFNGLVNKWVMLGFLFVLIYSVFGIFKNPALISLSILHDFMGIIAVTSFSVYYYRDNTQMIVRITNGLKNPFVIISIIIGVIAIVLSSYNYYFILVFLFYNFSIACLLVFLIRNHNNSKGIKTLSIFTIAKSTMKPISTQGFVIPGIFKVLLFLIIVLGLISYVVIFGPNQYLPTEQREIFAYENPLFYESDIWVNIATGFYSLLIYLKLLVYPNPLVFYYGFNHIPIVSMTNGWVIFSMILHIALFIFALLGLRQKRLISFAILYYLATISIFANIVIPIPGIVGERLLFMPSLGFSIFLGLVVYKLLSVSVFDKIIIRNKIKILAVAMILLIPYSYKTIARNFNWKDHLTLYLHDIPYLENSLHANSLVASHLFRDINPNPVNAGEKEGNTKKIKSGN